MFGLTKYSALLLLAALTCPAAASAQVTPLPEPDPSVVPPPLTPVQRSQGRLAAQLKLAELLEAKDDLKGALGIWTELLAGDPKNVGHLHQAARLAIQLERYTLARVLGRRLVKLQPRSLLGRTRLALALSETGLHAEALGHLRWVAGRAPRDPLVRRQLARALEATGSYAGALTQLAWLGAHGRSNLEDHLARVRLHRVLKQPHNERVMLRWLLPRVAGRSEETGVRQELAENLEADDDLAGALVQYHWLVGRCPKDLTSRLARLRLYGALNRPGRVRSELAAVVELASTKLDRREVREGLASAYELLKQPRKALEHYSWLVARHPQSVEYRLGRASMYGDLGQTRRQLAELVALARLAPLDPRVHRELGEYRFHQEQYPLAARHFRTVLRRAPKDTLALRRLAWMERARARLLRRLEAQRRGRQRLEEWISDGEERSEDF